MKKIKSLLILYLCCSVLFASAIAAQSTEKTQAPKKQEGDLESSFYIELSLGAGFPLQNTETDELIGAPDSPYFTSESTTEAIMASSVGYQWVTQSWLFPSFRAGAEYSHGFDSDVSGDVKYTAMTSDSYNYHMSRDTFLLLGKLNVTSFAKGRLMPYVLAGAGLSINQAKDINYFIGGKQTGVELGYSDASNTDFAFVVGAGLDYYLFDSVSLSAEYRYADYGDVKTGKGQGSFADAYMQKSFQDNEVLVSLRYLF